MPSISSPQTHHRHVIAIHGTIGRWIEPWYSAYAILGALASGFAALLIAVVIARSGGTAFAIGIAIAAQNIGVLSAPLWGVIADRTKSYRAIFFGGFLIMAAGFAAFSLLSGLGPWVIAAFLIGLGTGASNTVATLFVVEFTPKAEWSQRISWLQTFNAIGSVLGMAAAGWLEPRAGMAVAALLVVPALLVGGKGLPVPGGRFHVPHVPTEHELSDWLRHGGPNAAVLHLSRWRPSHMRKFGAVMASPFGTFLAGWFAFSLAASAFGSLYPVLMEKSFAVPLRDSAMLMSLATAISIPLYNLAGNAANRLGAPAVLRLGYIGRFVALAGMAALAFFRSQFGFWGAIGLFGLFQIVWPLLNVASNEMAASLAPFGEGPAIGLFSAAAAVASAAGALAGGAIAVRFGYAAVLAFTALAIVVALFTVRSDPKSAPVRP